MSRMQMTTCSRVEVEVDRLALADHLAQQVLEIIPERIIEVRRQLVGRLPLVDHVAHLAVNRTGTAEVAADEAGIGLLEFGNLLVMQLLPQFGTAQQVRGE
jgi:hypothetical protein